MQLIIVCHSWLNASTPMQHRLALSDVPEQRARVKCLTCTPSHTLINILTN